METPKWLMPYLQAKDLAKIEQVVREAELHTSGEIVPMVVLRSSTIGHVPIMLSLIFMTLFFAFEIHHWQFVLLDWPAWCWLLIDLVVLLAVVSGLSRLPFIERWLTPRGDQLEQVEKRALNEFFNHRIHHTERATGILVFVSLVERSAVVLGDEAISAKITSDTWKAVVDRLIASIKSNNLAEGFCEGVKMSGELLRQHFPVEKTDANELKNHLIIKE